MINILGTNIIASLGFTTDENFNAVKQGISGIKHYEAGVFDLPEPFMAALIDKERLNDEFATISPENNYTNLEKAAILSVFYANKKTNIDLSNEKTIFILSTTKGNIELLDMRLLDMRYETSEISNLKSQISNLKSHIYLWHTAELLTNFFHNPNTPVVVSNACISGAAAQILAMREIESGSYDHAVVVGVDLLSKFIISGFQSFKALSPELCRPFDKDRCGLNLGEGAATIIFGREIPDIRLSNMRYEIRDMRHETAPTESQIPNLKSQISLLCGAIRNDATHISAPSRTGEGSYRALKSILSNPTSQISHLTSQISFINAHGTATPYNDAMEMNAIARAGLEQIPVNSLKPYFGHTLGAAGVIETIISMRALNEGLILKTLGFEENEQLIINNEQFTLNVCKENRITDKNCFIKMMSGFGGVNATLLFATNYTDLH